MSNNVDEDLLQIGETKIWSLQLAKKGDKTKLVTKLNNFLFIIESAAVFQIMQNAMTLKNIFAKSAPRLFNNKP